MRTIRNFVMIFIGLGLLFTVACKKDKNGPTVPELTTTPVSSVGPTTAISGGTIVSNGGETISASGICWSKTNVTPTISDDTTKSNISSGSFIAMLKNLTPSTTYYVRAYATNRIGTGYGNVITFNAGNGAPTATNINVTGTPEVNMILTATYTYSDVENDAQSGSIFQWYVANDGTGAGETALAGATSLTYLIQAAQQGKYIRFGVTPKAATGTSTGTEVKSAFVGAIGEATTVTFTYNGTTVTYGILTSATTGKKWLDRNLGGTRLAQAINDHLAYGDLFQWGRLADGHQLLNRTGPNDGDATGVSGITSITPPFEFSTTDVPPTNKFIIVGGSGARDWRNPQNNNLWQGVNGINNPCPAGWRLPTKDEWIAEGLTNGPNAFSKLKLSLSGQRNGGSGSVALSTFGFYWTSTSKERATPGEFASIYLVFDAATYIDVSDNVTTFRRNGHAIRCIKD